MELDKYKQAQQLLDRINHKETTLTIIEKVLSGKSSLKEYIWPTEVTNSIQDAINEVLISYKTDVLEQVKDLKNEFNKL